MEATAQALPEGEKLYGTLPPDLGEWLFKEKDQVLGPVPPELLLGKLYDGHVNADTPVAQEIGQWKPLREIWFLGPHVNRAQQKQQYSNALAEREAALKNHARTRLAMAAVTFAVMFVASLGGARWTMIARPWEDKTDWLTRRPDLVKLPDRTPKLAVVAPAAKNDPTPTAAAGGTEPARNDDKNPGSGSTRPKEGRGDQKAKGKDPKENKGGGEKPVAAKQAEKPAEKDDVKTEAPAGSGGMPVELTKEQMLAAFKVGVPDYKGCIAAEATRNAEMPSTITVEFVIANDGTTRDFKIQERDLRDGPLAKCLGTRIASLKFPKFSGERKVFIFPFKITRK